MSHTLQDLQNSDTRRSRRLASDKIVSAAAVIRAKSHETNLQKKRRAADKTPLYRRSTSRYSVYSESTEITEVPTPLDTQGSHESVEGTLHESDIVNPHGTLPVNNEIQPYQIRLLTLL